MKKKIFALLMVFVLISGTICITAQDADPDEGKVVDNPWGDLFEGTKIAFDVADSVLEGENGAVATMEADGNNTMVHIVTTGSSEGDDTMWAIQSKSENIKVIVGELYKYSVTLLSDKDKEVVIKASSTDGNNTDYGSVRVALKANEKMDVSIDNIAPTTGEMQIIFALGTMGTENPTTNFTVQIKNSLLEGTLPKEEVTSEEASSEEQPSEETSSEEQSSEIQSSEIPSEVTTKGEESTTKAPVTTKTVEEQVKDFQKKCGIAKVKIASKKKKNAKKVTVTLKKKVKSADGLVVKIYKTRKNARANKKAIKTLYTKNAKKFTISNKKLKVKKLFIRVRGYKVIGGKKYYAKKWSVTKSIKIK